MTDHFDIVVIGGGIHGVGVAQAAAVRGYRIRLLEQAVLAAGTSSRSSKLIHGGLRYLESGQIALVRESLREREILLAIAPSLVERKAFHIPIYTNSRRTPTRIAIGLMLYRLLARGPYGSFQRIPARQWDTLDGLKTAGLKAVFRYYDAQTDDVALTEAVARSAAELGADIQTGARVTAIERTTSGYDVRFEHNGSVESCHALTVVNATGPWVAQTLNCVSPPPPRLNHDLVQGSHIVTTGTLTQGVYYAEAPADGRAVFLMPWRGQILTGTTETLYVGDPGQATPTAGEIAYLQEVLATYFPGLSTQVEASFAGLRVLLKTAQGLNARARGTVFLTDDPVPRLISIFGGKLTDYRSTADQVVARFAGVLPARVPRVDTRQLVLPTT
ncbi:MAG TPA: FAD-dependent oxidoreductase [Acidiferrobacter sp.]|nr:FAD-dependent oxidoreductase [Acidiferrobacter sp.]